MALRVLEFKFKADNPKTIAKDWSHLGVVGSGDLEVLMEQKDLDGWFTVKVVTPVVGFDKVWELVLGKFAKESQLGDIAMEINDNNATPIVVSMRLKQALSEANKMRVEGE